MTILLKDIWPIGNLNDYKVHFARENQYGSRPLDVWVRDRQEWRGWQESRPSAFKRSHIFSLMQFYHESKTTWLFGGIFEVIERHADRLRVELTEDGKNFIGRLKVCSPYTERQSRCYMEKLYGEFEVKEILAKAYSG